MIYRVRPLDPIDVHPSTLIELVIELFLFTLFIGDNSRVDSHLGVGSCSTTLRQSSWVDDEHTVDDLDEQNWLEPISSEP